MKQKTQQKKFIGAKKGDVVTFNPTKAFDSEVEVSSLLGITKEQAKDLKSDFTFEIQEITRHTTAAIDAELFAKVYGADAPPRQAANRNRLPQCRIELQVRCESYHRSNHRQTCNSRTRC
jgi:trigger factor